MIFCALMWNDYYATYNNFNSKDVILSGRDQSLN